MYTHTHFARFLDDTIIIDDVVVRNRVLFSPYVVYIQRTNTLGAFNYTDEEKM